jgi:hypothetical protein
MENYELTANWNPNKEEKMALDVPCPKKTPWIQRVVRIGLEPSGAQGAVVPKRPGKGRLRMKPWKQGRHGARLKDWLLTGPGGVSRMPYTPEGATGNDNE